MHALGVHTENMMGFADQLADELTADPGGGFGESSLGGLLDDARAVSDDREVLAVMAALIRARNVIDHAIAVGTACAERMQIPVRKRVRTGGALLVGLGMAPAAAYRAARLGAAAESVPRVARGMRDGAVSAEFGDAVVRGLDYIRKRADLDAELTAKVTDSLMVQVKPAAVDAKAKDWAVRLAPAKPASGVPAAEDPALNEVTLMHDVEGRVQVRMDLDVVAGEELQAALEPLSRPVPEPDGSDDKRPAKKRNADAFREVVAGYLSGSERPTSGGVLPHVTLLVPAAVSVDGRPIMAAVPDSASVPAPEVPTPKVGEPGGATRGAVDVERVVPAAASLMFGGAVTAPTAAMVMCEASVCAALVDGDGVPLKLGRESRLFTPDGRRALFIRDRGCAMCGAPVSRCDAHHMVEWQHGGETCTENGVLLCRLHHGWIHHLGWEVFLGHDGHPWFLAPIDPAHPKRVREPIRSYWRRTLNLDDLPCAA